MKTIFKLWRVMCMLLIAAGISTCGIRSQEVEPIVTTMMDLNKLEYAWFKSILESSVVPSWKGKTWATKAGEYCLATYPFARNMEGATRPQITLEQEIANSGCDDPVVLWLRSRMLHKSTADLDASDALLVKARNDTKRLPSALALLILTDYTADEERPRGQDANKSANELAGLISRALLDKCYSPNTWRVMMRHLSVAITSAAMKSDQLQKLDLDISAAHLPPWLQDGFQGYLHVDRAWTERGNGLAYKVTENGWKGFVEHIKEARQLLEKSLAAHPQSVEFASRLITVDKAEGANVEVIRNSLKRAIGIQIDWQPAYHAASTACEPKWGGSLDAMIVLAKDCIDTKRFDSVAPLQGIIILLQVASFTAPNKAMWNVPAVQEMVRSVADGYLAEKTLSQSNQQSICSLLAVVCHAIGDPLRTESALAKSGTALDKESLRWLGETGCTEQLLRLETRLALGQLGEPLAKFTVAVQKRDLIQVSQLASQIDATKQPAEVQHYLAGARQLSEFKNKFASGVWVALPTKPGLPGWLQSGDPIAEADATGDLILHGPDSTFGKWVTVAYDAPISGDCELRGEFDLTLSNINQTRIALFAPVLGYRALLSSNMPQPQLRAALIMDKSGQTATALICGVYYKQRKDAKQVKLKPSHNTFLMRLANGRLTFTLNDEVAIDEGNVAEVVAGPVMGLAGISLSQISQLSQFKIRNLEVRNVALAAKQPQIGE